MGIFKVRDSKIYDSFFKKFYQKENQDRIPLKKGIKKSGRKPDWLSNKQVLT